MSPIKHFNIPPVIDPSLLTEREMWVAEQTIQMTIAYLVLTYDMKLKGGTTITTTTTE